LRHPDVAGDREIQAVRAAAKYGFPTADIDRMLAEIESGQRSGASFSWSPLPATDSESSGN
jgi:hypothetical protein